MTLELCCWKHVRMEACWGGMNRLCSVKGAESGAVWSKLFIGADLGDVLFRIRQENQLTVLRTYLIFLSYIITLEEWLSFCLVLQIKIVHSFILTLFKKVYRWCMYLLAFFAKRPQDFLNLVQVHILLHIFFFVWHLFFISLLISGEWYQHQIPQCRHPPKAELFTHALNT